MKRLVPMSDYEVYAILWVAEACALEIASFLVDVCGVPRRSLPHGLHLTVYYARRNLPGLIETIEDVDISANTDETRFMVLAPGGENPRPGLVPSKRSLGIRLTRRNNAIEAIQELRRSVYKLETPRVIGNRKPTSAWVNCFGSRHFQPHVKVLKPGNQLQNNLTETGKSFRKQIPVIHFDKFQIRRTDNRLALRHGV